MWPGVSCNGELLAGITVPGSSAKATPPITVPNITFKMATNITRRARKTFSHEMSSRRAKVLLSPRSVGA